MLSELQHKPEFWEGVVFGLTLSRFVKNDELISESAAARMIPGCKTAERFRDKYVVCKNPQIDPYIFEGSTKRYYKTKDVLNLRESARRELNVEVFLQRKKRV